MKQTKLVLLLFCITTLSAMAQDENNDTGIDKGSWMVGGTLTLEESSGFNNIIFSVNPKVGYFVTTKLALGLNARYHHNGIYNNHTISGGPFARYYFVRSKFAPFAEADYNLGWSKTTTQPGLEHVESRSHVYGVGLGLNYFIVKNVALEGVIKFSHQDEGNSQNLSFNLGFQIFLNRKNK